MKIRPEISSLFLVRWLLQAGIAGIVAGSLVEFFQFIYIRGIFFVDSLGVSPLLWSFGAALLLGLFIYPFSFEAVGEGIHNYLKAVRPPGLVLPLGASILKFPATLITLIGFGNGGLVGPLGQINAGIVQWVTLGLRRILPFLFGDQKKHRHEFQTPTTAAICGVSAIIAAIFHAPIGAAVLAVEIIQKEQLRYHQIFPAILASSASVIWARLFGWTAVYDFSVSEMPLSVKLLAPVLIAGIASGYFGILYSRVYRFLFRLFNRETKRNLLWKLLVGMAISTSLGLITNPYLLRTSNELIPAILTGNEVVLRGVMPVSTPLVLILLFLVLVKLLGNSITVASGMSAGFVGPTMIIGMLGGLLLSHIFGFDPGSGEHMAIIIAAFSGMLASSMNVPLAAAILSLELFHPSAGMIGGAASMVAFQVARYSTIYDTAVQSTVEN